MTQPQKLRVYDFAEPREFLRAELDENKRKNPSFSVRQWAAQMGLEGPDLLAGLLSGKKRFRPRYLDFLRRALNLDALEELYFLTLILRKNSKDPEEISVFGRLLARLSPGEGVLTLISNDEDLYSDWAAMAILSGLEIPELRTEKKLLHALSQKLTRERAYTLLGMLKDK